MKIFSFDPSGTAQIDKAQADKILASDIAPAHVKAIVQAMCDYGIGWFFIPQTTAPIPNESFDEVESYIAIVGDDQDCAKGPQAFDQATLRRLIKTSSCIAIESSDIVVNIYSMCSTLAGMLQTGAMIIETRPEQEQAWLDYVRSVSKTIPIILSSPIMNGGTA